MTESAKIEKQHKHMTAIDAIQDLHYAVDKLETLRLNIENAPPSETAERPTPDSLTAFLDDLPDTLTGISTRIKSEAETIKSLIF
ncbi:hypothetical protein KAR91_34670 [Candidatus Pacearchaeota archaeon]|nr:hypothetical protein [Candidatus Pacearchaeota archaeon]